MNQPNWSPFHCERIPKDAKPEEYHQVAEYAWLLSDALAHALGDLAQVLNGRSQPHSTDLTTSMITLSLELRRVNNIAYDVSEALVERLAREKPGPASLTEAA